MLPAELAALDFCYVTTTGRTTGGHHRIEIWFAIETGVISINSNSSVRYSTPFGGFKQSGLGRELGPDALLGFSEEKNVFISTEDN